jgi:hypothetical protein
MSNASKTFSTGKNDPGSMVPVVLDRYNMPESVASSKTAVKRPKNRLHSITLTHKEDGLRSGYFEDLEFNMVEIAKAATTESYVMRAFIKFNTLMMKNGWKLDGWNPVTVNYVHRRIRQISLNTNQPFSVLVRSVVNNISEYCNAFLVFKRDSDRSYGRSMRMYGRQVAPIAGIFSADPTCMQVKRNEHGTPIEWRQMVDGQNVRTYRRENVVHFFYNRADGFIGGTPWIVPVLDDIRSWRRIEEISELVASRHGFPLYHYAVGTETNPAEVYDDGTSEVDSIKATIENTPLDGCVVTPERHTIVVVGGNDSIMDLSPYLEYWEQRVISGLGLSGIDLGRGEMANKATAAQLSKSLADFCRDMQNVIAEFFDFYIFDVLLEEGGYDTSEFNRVHLSFPVIDSEEMLTNEKHQQHMFQNHMVTRGEARQNMGYSPITPEMEKDMYMERIDIPLALIKAVDESSGLGKKPDNQMKVRSAASSAQKKRKNKSENVNRPTNQYGKLPAKTKPVRDAVVDWWLHATDSSTLPSIVEQKFRPLVANSMEHGMRTFGDMVGRDFFVGDNMKGLFFRSCVSVRLTDILTLVDDNKERVHIRRAALPLLDRVLRNMEVAAENFGFRYAALLDGYNHVRWVLSDKACDACRQLSSVARSVRGMTFDDLVPPHEDCIVGQTLVMEAGLTSNFLSETS